MRLAKATWLHWLGKKGPEEKGWVPKVWSGQEKRGAHLFPDTKEAGVKVHLSSQGSHENEGEVTPSRAPLHWGDTLIG